MGFYLYQSNNLQVLAEELAQRVNQPFMPNSLGDPLQQEIIVVPDRSMARWVYLQLATANIIAPEAEMLFPGAFVYQYLFDPMMQHHTGATAEGELPFAPPTVTWRILALLPELEVLPGFENVAGFTQDDTFKRYQLATRLAELFDRYMTYRPDLLAAWELGQQPLSGSDATWQAELWQNLVGNNTLSPKHFSGLYQKFVAELEITTPPYLTKILQKRRIYYFGHPTLPPVHLDLLLRLSGLNDFDVHFFVVNPSQEEWSFAASLKKQLRDKIKLVELTTSELASNYLVTSNPLLGSLGRSGRDFFYLLLAYDELDTSNTHFVIPDSTTLLGKIQHDILTNAPPDSSYTWQPGDYSINFHICHSPMREVEVLHDQLLLLFTEYPDLNPADIVVYAPNMANYAPYIDAIFGVKNPGEAGCIPYTITEKSRLQEHPECQALLALIKIVESRFKSSEVIELLEYATIRNHFNISADEVTTITTLLDHANLAWGLDGKAREKTGTAPTYTATWRFALDRLVLGVAMWDPDQSALPLTVAGNPVLPCDQAEGQAEVISKLLLLIEHLEVLSHNFSTNCSGLEWYQRLEWLLDNFFEQQTQEPYGVIVIRKTLETLRKYILAAQCETELPLAVIQTWLHEQLEGVPPSGNLRSGRVNFSNFQPLAAVSAKVVCLLGMNDGTLPRQTPYLSFDLMEHQHTKGFIGDRRIRDEDRYVFLQVLMAAQESLIILYTGRSTVDNSPIPPAVLVSELMDMINATTGCDTCKALQVEHPLQPFGYKYFLNNEAREDPRLISYSRSSFQIATGMLYSASQADISLTEKLAIETRSTVELPSVISLHDLQRFFRNPAKYFYNRVLGIQLEAREQVQLSDEDVLEIDSLELYNLKLELLQSLQQGVQIDPLLLEQRYHAAGRIPTGFGNTITAAQTEVANIWNKVTKIAPQIVQKVVLELPLIPQLEIRDELDIYGNTHHIHVIPASIKPKYQSDLWLTHLVLSASGVPVESTLIGAGSKLFQLGVMEQESARARLVQLANRYVAGQSEPLCFLPDIGWKLHNDPDAYINNALWEGDDFNFPDADACFKHAFGSLLTERDAVVWQQMQSIAFELFGTPPDLESDNTTEGKD